MTSRLFTGHEKDVVEASITAASGRVPRDPAISFEDIVSVACIGILEQVAKYKLRPMEDTMGMAVFKGRQSIAQWYRSIYPKRKDLNEAIRIGCFTPLQADLLLDNIPREVEPRWKKRRRALNELTCGVSLTPTQEVAIRGVAAGREIEDIASDHGMRPVQIRSAFKTATKRIRKTHGLDGYVTLTELKGGL